MEDKQPRKLTKAQEVERSIVKKYRKELWNPFIKAVKKYELIQAGDKIAVCISGGKDSFVMAKLFQQLKRHTEVPFKMVFLVMNPGYNEENMTRITRNAELLNIPLTVFNSDIYDTVATLGGSPCYICARMRRGYLYKNAQELGCNKIALGHHLDDVVETVVMSMFYGAQLQTMPPKLRSDNFAGMELIRPLYATFENDILAWVRYNNLEFIKCACRFTEKCSPDADENTDEGARAATKRLLKILEKETPGITNRIFNSIHNVHIDTMPGYKRGGQLHSFLEDY